MSEKLRKSHPYGGQTWSYDKIFDLPEYEKRGTNRIRIGAGTPPLKEIHLKTSADEWPRLDCIDITSSIDKTESIILESPTVEVIFCHSKSVKNLDISKCPNVEIIDVSRSSISNLDLTNCSPELEQIRCHNTPLKSLDVSLFRMLKGLNISDTQIEHIQLGNNRALEAFWANNTPLKELDLSANHYLSQFQADGIGRLTRYEKFFLSPGATGQMNTGNMPMKTIVYGVMNTLIRYARNNPAVLQAYKERMDLLLEFAEKIADLEARHENKINNDFFVTRLFFKLQSDIDWGR
ncbi:MAG: hypothetical protein LBJ73_04205 [Rickettsiales bacterium]|nr:hypothetical protein [Rickettsiales bacterium]